MSFLEGTTFTLDPQAREFRWGLPDASCRWVPLSPRARDPRPFARLDVGNGPEAVLLDTGAEGTLYGLDLPLGEACEVAGGLTGVRPIGVGRRTLELLGERYEGLRVCSGGDLRILGAAFLCAGPTVFDFPGKRLGLVQDAHGKIPRPPALSGEAFFPVAWNRTGTEAFLEAVPLQACSRWYRAGFREGDRIVAVEGVAEPLTLSKLNQRIREGLPLRWVVLRNGQQLRLISPPEPEIRWFLGS